MIIDLLIFATLGVLNNLFSLVPDGLAIPMPEELAGMYDNFMNSVSDVTGVISVFVGPDLYPLILGLTLAIFMFEQWVDFGRFILRVVTFGRFGTHHKDVAINAH